MLFAAGLAGVVTGQQDAAHEWSLKLADKESDAPLGIVLVTFPDHDVSRITDTLGLVAGPNASGPVRFFTAPLGYTPLDTTITVPELGGIVQVSLARSPLELSTLTVEAQRTGTSSKQLNRMIFNREILVGAIGVTHTEIVAVPAVAEADVFRSLQAFVGVISPHDLAAEIFVRGGNADQVRVLLDGAPVFAPHHMFGLFGAFNPDVIQSVEFYKGSLPARHGGSLSGLISARQRVGEQDGARVSGGLSLLGLRFAAEGSLPWSNGRWLVAGRQASVDVARLALPYSFHDFNLGLQLFPAQEHRLRWSTFASDDSFAWALDARENSLESDWSNLASSLSWSWIRDNRLTFDATAYYSGYRARMAVGTGPLAPVTRNRISLTGVRGNVAIRGDRTGIRAGIVLEGGPLTLEGSRRGAYMEGDASGEYVYAGVHAELERWIGPLRLATGVRTGIIRGATGGFVEPRVSARYHGGDYAVSVSLDRTSQFLSVLRDDRYLGPGAPMWFLHDQGGPASVADGIGLSADTWWGEEWTGNVTGWARRLTNTASWRPLPARDRSEVEFENGHAYGWETSLQRHAGRVRGWVAYQYAKVGLTDSKGRRYHPKWDRRHEVDATLSWYPTPALSVSLRTTAGSGTPFWFSAGNMRGWVYDPRGRISGGFRGGVAEGEWFEIWSSHQGRFQPYARIDASVRYRFQWGNLGLEPYLSVVNLSNRDNLGQRYRHGLPAQIPLFPFIGVNVEF